MKRMDYIGMAARVALIGYALFFGKPAAAQQPDCIVFFQFTASGQTSPTAPNAGLSNLTTGCTTWSVSYANTGFSALTLAFQSAPNVNGAPGSWSTFAGANILSGINPNTNTTGTFTQLTGYNPWVRMALTAATGSGQVNGSLFGWRIPSAGLTPAGTTTVTGTVAATQSGAWSVGQTGAPWSVNGPAASGAAPSGNPLWFSGLGSGATGGLLYPQTNCDQSAIVNVTAANTTQLVALTASRSIRVCSWAVSISLAGTAQFVSGTGSNCGSGTANLTGALSIATGVTSNQGSGSGELFHTPAGNALCLAAVTGNVTGVVSYAVY